MNAVPARRGRRLPVLPRPLPIHRIETVEFFRPECRRHIEAALRQRLRLFPLTGAVGAQHIPVQGREPDESLFRRRLFIARKRVDAPWLRLACTRMRSSSSSAMAEILCAVARKERYRRRNTCSGLPAATRVHLVAQRREIEPLVRSILPTQHSPVLRPTPIRRGRNACPRLAPPAASAR